MYKTQDLVEYAFNLIIESDRDVEELHNWDAFSIAEQLAQDIEVGISDTIEFSDRQYKDLLDQLETLVKIYESEIDEKIEQYVNECMNMQNIEWRFA